jgi:hypothetical protein
MPVGSPGLSFALATALLCKPFSRTLSPCVRNLSYLWKSFRRNSRGGQIEIRDSGVGMAPDRLTRRRDASLGARPHSLRNSPHRLKREASSKPDKDYKKNLEAPLHADPQELHGESPTDTSAHRGQMAVVKRATANPATCIGDMVCGA